MKIRLKVKGSHRLSAVTGVSILMCKASDGLCRNFIFVTAAKVGISNELVVLMYIL